MIIIVMIVNDNPSTLFENWGEYCESKFIPLLRVQTNKDYYLIEKKPFIKWKKIYFSSIGSYYIRDYNKTLELYREVKQEYQKEHNWNTIIIPDETELGKTLNNG